MYYKLISLGLPDRFYSGEGSRPPHKSIFFENIPKKATFSSGKLLFLFDRKAIAKVS